MLSIRCAALATASMRNEGESCFSSGSSFSAESVSIPLGESLAPPGLESPSILAFFTGSLSTLESCACSTVPPPSSTSRRSTSTASLTPISWRLGTCLSSSSRLPPMVLAVSPCKSLA